MPHALALALLLLGGILLAFVILFTSSALFGYYLHETVRGIRRWGARKLE